MPQAVTVVAEGVSDTGTTIVQASLTNIADEHDNITDDVVAVNNAGNMGNCCALTRATFTQHEEMSDVRGQRFHHTPPCVR